MQEDSKVAIFKMKLVEPKDSEPFILATIVENVYNSKRPFASKWESVFYEAYIFDTTQDLEPAIFEKKEGKAKYSYDCITNPDKSIIRVQEFKCEPRSVWRGQEQVLDDSGKPQLALVTYIYKFCRDKGTWKSKSYIIKELENKRLALMETIREQKKTITEKDAEIRRLNKIIEGKDKKIEETKDKLGNTRYNLKYAKTKLKKKDQEIEKKEKIIEENEQIYEEFGNILFDDM